MLVSNGTLLKSSWDDDRASGVASSTRLGEHLKRKQKVNKRDKRHATDDRHIDETLQRAQAHQRFDWQSVASTVRLLEVGVAYVDSIDAARIRSCSIKIATRHGGRYDTSEPSTRVLETSTPLYTARIVVRGHASEEKIIDATCLRSTRRGVMHSRRRQRHPLARIHDPLISLQGVSNPWVFIVCVTMERAQRRLDGGNGITVKCYARDPSTWRRRCSALEGYDENDRCYQSSGRRRTRAQPEQGDANTRRVAQKVSFFHEHNSLANVSLVTQDNKKSHPADVMEYSAAAESIRIPQGHVVSWTLDRARYDGRRGARVLSLELPWDKLPVALMHVEHTSHLADIKRETIRGHRFSSRCLVDNNPRPRMIVPLLHPNLFQIILTPHLTSPGYCNRDQTLVVKSAHELADDEFGTSDASAKGPSFCFIYVCQQMVAQGHKVGTAPVYSYGEREVDRRDTGGDRRRCGPKRRDRADTRPMGAAQVADKEAVPSCLHVHLAVSCYVMCRFWNMMSNTMSSALWPTLYRVVPVPIATAIWKSQYNWINCSRWGLAEMTSPVAATG
ncbi:hypothetical protein V8E55_008273 [Tylopilus felleus]